MTTATAPIATAEPTPRDEQLRDSASRAGIGAGVVIAAVFGSGDRRRRLRRPPSASPSSTRVGGTAPMTCVAPPSSAAASPSTDFEKAAANSPELAGRSDASRSSARAITRSSAGGHGTPGRVSLSVCARSVSRMIIVSCAVPSAKGSVPVSMLKRHERERVDVAARVHRVARELLGAHVLRRADDESRLRHLLRRAVLRLRDPEVHDLHEIAAVAVFGRS